MIMLPRYAHNVGTVQFYRSAARHYGCRTWRTAMDRFAVQHGKAICIMGDDSARIVERGTMARNGTYSLLRQDIAATAIRWI